MEQGTHILLVDDENEFRFSASVALRGAGFRVTLAMNGFEAFARIVNARAEGDPVRVLVTDQQMPGMTGMELVSALRARGIEVPAILITAYRDASIEESLHPDWIRELVEKPIAPEELVACLARVAGKYVEKSA